MNAPDINYINEQLRSPEFLVPLPNGFSYDLYLYNPDAYPNWGLYARVNFAGCIGTTLPSPVHTAVYTEILDKFDGREDAMLANLRDQIRAAAVKHYTEVVASSVQPPEPTNKEVP